MSTDTTVIPFRQPDAIDDPLTEVAREGARRMLAQVLIAEADAFVALWKDLKLPDGRDRVVRHGHGPQRAIQTGVGPVEVRRAKVRDRGDVGTKEKIRFTSAILPKWARRTKSLDALLPVLYLRGVSAGDFQEGLAALLGKDAPNLSPAVISRLTAEWQGDYDAWQKRDLSARQYVYVWADGVYLQARMEDNAECMLVLIGATPEGKKELVGFQTGVRESAQSWRAGDCAGVVPAQRPTAERVRELHGQPVVWITPDEVAAIVANLEAFRPIAAIKRLFPGAEILGVRPAISARANAETLDEHSP
jgi:putative transposase